MQLSKHLYVQYFLDCLSRYLVLNLHCALKSSSITNTINSFDIDASQLYLFSLTWLSLLDGQYLLLGFGFYNFLLCFLACTFIFYFLFLLGMIAFHSLSLNSMIFFLLPYDQVQSLVTSIIVYFIFL